MVQGVRFLSLQSTVLDFFSDVGGGFVSQILRGTVLQDWRTYLHGPCLVEERKVEVVDSGDFIQRLIV
jgi:hypothetical protein